MVFIRKKNMEENLQISVSIEFSMYTLSASFFFSSPSFFSTQKLKMSLFNFKENGMNLVYSVFSAKEF